MIMCAYNKLIHSILSSVILARQNYTSNHRVLIKGRIAAWVQVLVFVLFVFSFSACSSNEKAEKSEGIDSKPKFQPTNGRFPRLISVLECISRLICTVIICP